MKTLILWCNRIAGIAAIWSIPILVVVDFVLDQIAFNKSSWRGSIGFVWYVWRSRFWDCRYLEGPR